MQKINHLSMQCGSYRKRGTKGRDCAHPVLEGREIAQRLERPKLNTQKAPTRGSRRRSTVEETTDESLKAMSICNLSLALWGLVLPDTTSIHYNILDPKVKKADTSTLSSYSNEPE